MTLFCKGSVNTEFDLRQNVFNFSTPDCQQTRRLYRFISFTWQLIDYSGFDSGSA